MTSTLRRSPSRWRSALPVGRSLPDDLWARRHRGILLLLWAHLPILLLYPAYADEPVVVVLGGAGAVILCALAGSLTDASRHFRAGFTTFGLVLCSALLVYYFDGRIELHFHFFVIVGIITLYQDWLPFLVAITFTLLEHGVLGVLDPTGVYDHAGAHSHPWLWALVHGGFLSAAAVSHVLSWRMNEELALRDPLTRLANRTLFTDRLGLALARRDRHGDPVSVLFIDLDRFKVVNDTLGHAIGDKLLREAGERICRASGPGASVARFGGDEFAVLLTGPSAIDSSALAERIIGALRAPTTVDGHEFLVDASIGVVDVDSETTAEEMLRNADLAMYEAKGSGGGRVEVFRTALFNRAVESAELEADLRRAVENGEIEVYYQPTVCLAGGHITGVEALARWIHPTRGMISPPRSSRWRSAAG